MQTTEVVSVRKTSLKSGGKTVYEVSTRTVKDGWNHKVANITQLCTLSKVNGQEFYVKVY